MTAIGHFKHQILAQSLEQFLAARPPAVLLRHMAPIAFLPTGGKSGDTDGRLILEHGVSTPSGVSAPSPVTPEQSYRVYRLQSATAGAEAPVIIGRCKDCDIMFNDQSIDDEHIGVERRGATHIFQDRDSLTGTALNGQYVEPGELYPLRPGDRLTIGALDLTFLDAEGFYNFVLRYLGLDKIKKRERA